MSTAFQPMSPDEKDRFRSAYLAHLRARDGVPDLAAQRFDIRERFFARIDASPLCWKGTPPVDQGIFDRNYSRSSPERGLDEATLWALATAKTNRAERFGVEREFEAHGVPANAAEDPHVYIQVEEFYHTRILEDALAAVGVRMSVSKPGFTTQMLVRTMVHLPDDLSDVMVLCGEIVGVAIFSLLLGKARTLFAAQPEALARVETLFAQILVDEVGHVHFVRSRLTAFQLGWAKRLLPLVAHGALEDLPELVLLFGRKEILRHAVAADVDAAAAPYPDRFVVNAA
ncbi:MAG: hypothetical protein Q8P41_17790 [Pseudomonadota bacterium]|nr:hypothetical protein [Pseudomonadota bacterium]